MALYQQLREYREAIESNPDKQDVILRSQTESKSIQTDPIIMNNNINTAQKKAIRPQTVVTNQSDNLESRSKRQMSSSPKFDKISKRPKISNEASKIDTKEDSSGTNETGWKKVEHHKNRKKKTSKDNRYLKESGEALTIKPSDSKSYADMLKQMKSSINPSEMGVEINEMRRTKNGELLIKLKPGEGQADKLKQVLSTTLGEEVTIRSAIKYISIDIRDMDESTEEQEILGALMTKSGVQEPSCFKILNIRESYGKTRQALVKIPISIASKLLTENRIKIGWIRCRIREKPKPVKCFRCLDQGHIGKECSGVDRSDICTRCCNKGHKSKECNKELRCIVCQEAGLSDIKHFIGSSICVSNRRNNKNKHALNICGNGKKERENL